MWRGSGLTSGVINLDGNPPHRNVITNNPRPPRITPPLISGHQHQHHTTRTVFRSYLHDGPVASSASKSSIRMFVIMEKSPTRAFSWLKAATTAFTFKTLLRHYAKRASNPRSLNVKLGPRRNYHKGRAAIRHYANQTARPL